MVTSITKRVYTKKVINKGWFKKGTSHNRGRHLDEAARKKLSISVKKAMRLLPESVKKRIKKHQFKKGCYYAHWKGKYGPAHPNYKGIAYRNMAIAAKGRRCEKCGRTRYDSIRKLHVHHKDGNRRNNKISNLKILCSACHMNLHKNWKYRWKVKK